MEERGNENRNRMHIDNILASQPELGPNIPDGGYGWVIVVASAFFHVLVPSIPVGLGIFLLFSRVANGNYEQAVLWDNNIAYVSLFFIATSTIAAPLARLLALNSTWPRLVATAGTSLTCGGILLIWPTINGNASNSSLFVLAGIFAGGGASIILAQVDILLLQYFKLKLELVRTIMYLGEAVGFIITPIALGHTIIQSDLLHIITWYQAILLQGVILSIAFRKPNYLKSASQRYRLIRGLSDEEEDVFAKNTTELQNPRASQMESGTPSVSNPPDAVGQNGTARHWETFDESTTPRTARTELHKTFAIEFSNDLDHNSHASFEDNYVPIPKPLFSESRINNNTSYSYEGGVGNEDPVVFMPNAAPAKNNSWEKILSVLKEPTFYKSLLFTITTRFAMFAFWTLFPTYLYIKIDRFKIHNTPSIVGALSVSSLMFSPALNWAKKSHKLRPLLIWIFCWMGAVGFLFFNEAGDETALIFGAVVITISLNACQILGVPLMNINNYGEHTVSYVLLCAITAISLLSLLAIDVNYRGCFGIVAVLEFVTGSVWLANYVYKKMKNIR